MTESFLWKKLPAKAQLEVICFIIVFFLADLQSNESESWLVGLLNDQEWKTRLAPCFSTEKFKKMEAWLKEQYKQNDVLPPKSLIFNAFNMTRFANVSELYILCVIYPVSQCSLPQYHASFIHTKSKWYK